MIPQSFIQELLNRVDIVDVVESYVPLKRAGANYAARCPFHSEKSPSFTVSQTKQFYHCFGCGAHGTAISFLMEHQGMGFIDAVKDLAGRVGMVVPEQLPDPKRKEKIEAAGDLTDVMSTAAQFYKSQLRSSDKAVAYLKNRGLTGEIAARYGLGYAPEGWQGLEAVFPDYQAKSLTEAGLVIASEEGRRYDRFRDRVMFPIHNQRGAIIGFGGRVIDQGEPKYLNSPETPLFEKGRELYGLFQARSAIRDAGRVVVVEGYMDVVALAQYGIGYAVATLGTATTPWQVQKLLRQTDNVIYCFDGDAAGRRAAWRALENSLSQLQDGKNLRFLFLPAEHDPDSYVRANGQEAFAALLDSAPPLSEILVQELTSRVDMRTAEGRAKFLQEAKPLVKQVAAPMLSMMLRKQIAQLAGITQAELDGSFEIKSISRARAPERRESTKPSLVRALIEMLAFQPALAAMADIDGLRENADLVSDGLPQSELALLERVLELCAGRNDMGNIAEHFRGTGFELSFREIETASLKWESLTPEAIQAEFEAAWARLLERFRHVRITALLEKSKRESWTSAEKEEFRRLQQGTVNETPG
ncbi:MAG TPA: DNA primase [Burkholderiales bacterium]|nr:DNA primase [Burkholderiales bacterium]